MPLKPPPLDANGKVVPHDHDEIGPDHRIIRRISEHQIAVNNHDGTKRISSMVFRESSDSSNSGMSVDLYESIVEAGLDPAEYVTNPKYTGSIVTSAEVFRSQDLLVGYYPITDNPHHGAVWGNFSRGRVRQILAGSEWLVPVTGVSLKT